MGIQEPNKRVRGAYLPGKIKNGFIIFCNTNLGWTRRTPLPHGWRDFWLPGLGASSELVLLRVTLSPLWPWERLLDAVRWPAQGSHFHLRLSLVSYLSSAPAALQPWTQPWALLSCIIPQAAILDLLSLWRKNRSYVRSQSHRWWQGAIWRSSSPTLLLKQIGLK